MRITHVLLIVTLVVLAVVAYSAWNFGGFSTRSEPSYLETGARALGPRVRHSISSPRRPEPGAFFFRGLGRITRALRGPLRVLSRE